MFIIPYQDNQSGFYPNREDKRDFMFAAVMSEYPLNWQEGFEVKCIDKLKIENQGKSLSCGGQSGAKYKEVLDFIDVGELVDLSPKSIYGQIYLPSGGVYTRDLADHIVNVGVNKEATVPSYKDGNPPDESFMRELTITDFIRREALIYKARKYYFVGNNIDEMARAIEAGNGMIIGVWGHSSGWQTADPAPIFGADKTIAIATWGHLMYAYGYGMRNGQKVIKVLNSWGKFWGENGKGYINEVYFKTPARYSNYLYSSLVQSGVTLIDQPNVSGYNSLTINQSVRLLSRFVSGINERDWARLEAGDPLMEANVRKQMIKNAEIAPLSVIRVEASGAIMSKNK